MIYVIVRRGWRIMNKLLGFLKDIFKCAAIGIIISFIVMIISWGTGYISYKRDMSIFKRDLKPEMEGNDIRRVQMLLKKGGYFTDDITGKFDDKMDKALMLFQEMNNLPVTGNILRSDFELLSKKVHLYNRVKNAAYYVSALGLMLSAAFFITRDGTRPLIYNDEWRKHFVVLNLALVIMFISFTIGISAMIFQGLVH